MKKIIAFVVTAAVMISSAAFAGDAGNGAKLYKTKCKACHTLDGKDKVGPSFKGVFGRDSKMAGKLDEAGMTAWLKDPAAVNKDSKMAKLFKTKLKDGDIADIIEYLKTL